MIGLLLDYRAWLVAAIVGLGLYAAVQRLEKEHAKAEFAQFRADVESEAAKAKVAAARQEAIQATHAQEALDDLTTRNAALSRSYERLRHANASIGGLPSLSSAATVVSSCPGKPDEPDPAARFLAEVEGRVTAIIETGDREIAKYAELWKLEQDNAR